MHGDICRSLTLFYINDFLNQYDEIVILKVTNFANEFSNKWSDIQLKSFKLLVLEAKKKSTSLNSQLCWTTFSKRTFSTRTSRCIFENAERNVIEEFTWQYLDEAASSNYLYVLPAYVGSFNGDYEMTSYKKGLCFRSMTFKVDVRNSVEDRAAIPISGTKNFLCKDWFLLTKDKLHIDLVFSSGEHLVTLKNLSQDDLAALHANGVRINMFCNGVIKTIESNFP